MGAGNFMDNNCRVICKRITATTPTICMTAAGYTQVIGVRIVNRDAAATPLVNLIYKPIADGVSYFYQANYPLAPTTALWFPFDAFGMYEGDQMLVQSSIANTVDAFMLIAELPGRNQ